MPRQQSLLLITNQPSTTTLLGQIAPSASHFLQTATTTTEGLDALAARKFDLIILDLTRSANTVLDCLRAIKHDDPEAAVIVTVPADDTSLAVQTFRLGALDALIRPITAESLRDAIAKTSTSDTQPTELASARGNFSRPNDKVTIVGQTPVMRQVERLMAKVAPTDATALICGESGTGKELVARAIHLQSSRSKGPFVAVDCSSLVENLFESELFGHVRGSFTGATVTKHGRFELADGGTIFLDEIGQISPNLQGKLLRVLQEREIIKVGSNQVVKVDVRVIAATNTQLELAAAQGKFRRELFYRLHVVPILMPALRERKDDIPLLADHFLEKYRLIRHKNVRQISPAAMHRLCQYDWPGNVRELEHVIERALVLADGAAIEPQDLTFSAVANELSDELPEDGRLAAVEKRHIQHVFHRFQGHRGKTAEYLGIDRKTLRTKLAKYGISA